MVTIQDYIDSQLEEINSATLAKKLQVSLSMLSSYKKSYNPSLDVAKRVYRVDSIALHPFSKESLDFEISKDA